MICEICGLDYSDSSGHFTLHLLDTHNVTREEYVIISEYNGVPPLCECGYCNCTPVYRRGKFMRYAKGHNTHEWKNKRYIERYDPRCALCGDSVQFRRDRPNKLCKKCLGDCVGFRSEAVQTVIRKGVVERYGVENIMYVNEVRDRHLMSIKNIERSREVSEDTKIKHSNALKMRWLDKSSRATLIAGISIAVRKESERNRRRDYVLNRILNEPDYLIKLLSYAKGSTRLSKLHVKARGLLGLSRLGFASEVPIGRYVVDELHFDTKTVIEINGDYIHANPIKYSQGDLIRTHCGSYTAQDKWEYDARRSRYLNSLGYNVVVVWESDLKDDLNLSAKIHEIEKLVTPK